MNDETLIKSDFDLKESDDLANELPELKEPFDPKEIDIQVVQTTMDNLIKRLSHKEIDLNPDFQRTSDLWRNELKGRLIESLLIRLPIPAFYFDASNDDLWQVVDGLQRLTTIKRFVLDKTLKLSGLEFLKEYNKKTIDDLPRSLTRRIEEAPVTLYLIKPGTPLNVKYSLFYRINTGGLTLNPQEIRHALSQSVNNGQASQFLKKIAESDYFKKYVRVYDKRMLDKELIFRYIAFKITNFEKYKEPMIKFLNEAMELLGRADKTLLNKLETDFKKAILISWDIFGENAFRKSIKDDKTRKVINRALFEVITTILSELTEEEIIKIKKNKEKFLREYLNLLNKTEFDNRISISTTYSDNVKYRFKIIRELVNYFL
jgi:hypothetical protein